MNVQKALFPGIFLGVMSLIWIANLLTATPATARTEAAAAKNDAVPVAAVAAHNQAAAENYDCTISPAYPESIRQWCSIIQQYANDHGLDPNLISAVMLQESAGKPDAYSKSGAVGLMQVMPRDGKASGFMCINGPCFADRPSIDELMDPEYNVSYGTRMLAGLIQRNGGVRDALKAYGPKDVGYYYADIVLGIFNSHQ
jgi:soluble lytic murein transglycosylase-like protein